MRLNVYGVSSWPEDCGEKFLIYENKEFPSKEVAVKKARQEYSRELEVITELVK